MGRSTLGAEGSQSINLVNEEDKDSSSSGEGDCNSGNSEDELSESELEELQGNIINAIETFD